MEEAQLYKLIVAGSQHSLTRALKFIDTLSEEEIKLTDGNGNTYLHILINSLRDVESKTGDVLLAVPLIYKLAIKGVDVNARNQEGHTALHLACIRKGGENVAQHLIRIGIDATLEDQNGGRVIHHLESHKCWYVKGQRGAKCSIWTGIILELLSMTESYLKAWTRVNVKRIRRTMIEVAYDTGNYETVRCLERFAKNNEMVCIALSCDAKLLSSVLSQKHEKYDVNIKDYSQRVPKPLIAELEDLGKPAAECIAVLKKFGATDSTGYRKAIQDTLTEFEDCEFYKLVDMCTPSSLDSAWQLADKKGFFLNAVSHKEGTAGWSYLHLLVHQYVQFRENSKITRRLVRLMFKLAIDGLNVNLRTETDWETPLTFACRSGAPRVLLDYLIQLGVDASIRTRDRLVVAYNMYATRGELILDSTSRQESLPGLWSAVEGRDMDRVKRSLESFCRVTVVHNGRSIYDFVKDLEYVELFPLLEQYMHVNDFVAATLACDLAKMKHYLALGEGKRKVNIRNRWFYAGSRKDFNVDYISRPLIKYAIEECTPDVVQFLINFDVALDAFCNGVPPCGPAAFWAFQDHIEPEVTFVIAKHANLGLRDERGATMLHRAVAKNDESPLKLEIIRLLLERGIDLALRNIDGSTARDYVFRSDCTQRWEIRQIIDDHVLMAAQLDNLEYLEHLLIEAYDNIDNVRGTAKMKSAMELASMRSHKDVVEFLSELNHYSQLIRTLQKSIVMGDVKTFTRYLYEKKAAWSIDERGRNILHLAVLFERHELVNAIIEQFPHFITKPDTLLRTAVHYAICLPDRRIYNRLTDAIKFDASMRDANNLTVSDYYSQIQKPIPVLQKARGAREYNYEPKSLIRIEREATLKLLVFRPAELKELSCFGLAPEENNENAPGNQQAENGEKRDEGGQSQEGADNAEPEQTNQDAAALSVSEEQQSS